ncbi:MAG TPA: alpha-glucan family phosphorylase [Flavisolibacter sp.]|nr:alpha-glucan family phosphorylase [Flavisolibacter sp.]
MDRHPGAGSWEHIHALRELAMDLHWSWNHATDKIWKQLDPVLWQLTHNPLVVLQTASKNRIEQVLEDPIVREIIQELIEVKKQRSVAPAWFQKTHPGSRLKNIAYFSMEYMLSEALPIYSGGLGNVSGDLLKTASDLGVPVTGIGLLYQQGYARQLVYKDGSQQYVAPYNDPGQLPVTPLRNENGEWLRIEIQLPGYSLWLRTWKVQVGRVLLLLLDSNDAANFPNHRGITSELYGSDPDLRLLQEIILGIGGYRLLKELGIHPDVVHLNEGHSAFAVLEEARNCMLENNQSFDIALNVTRAGTIFTTHTAIGAGFDRFPPELIKKYLGSYINNDLKISLHDFLALGRKNANDEEERFNTAYLAIRGSEYINGVSKLHAQVSKQLFAELFPGWPVDEVPVGYVTNGVHVPTWDSPEADKVWTEACGKERWLGSTETIEKNINSISDERLWKLRTIRSTEFVEDVREHYSQQLETIGGNEQEINEAKQLFNPAVLIMGFARRFVPYKRPNLLLHDKNRLKNILSNKEKPVQLVLAGKAHPKDFQSQELIREWIRFISDFDLKSKVVFLSDYDMLLTEQMVQGVDLWINTPRRPWEACGTSGMKVLVNGGLNVSELDGWWDEVFSPEVGWTFGDRKEIIDDALHDREDAERLYDLLEKEIIPLFYKRDERGIPVEWVQRMRQSMARLTLPNSSVRSLQQYTENYYLPAAALYQKRLAHHGAEGSKIEEWKTFVSDHWKGIYYGNPFLEAKDDEYNISVPVFLNGMNQDEVSVELYANAINGNAPVKKKMLMNAKQENGTIIFSATVPADRPSHYYTPRIVPVNDAVSIPLECSRILWQH